MFIKTLLITYSKDLIEYIKYYIFDFEYLDLSVFSFDKIYEIIHNYDIILFGIVDYNIDIILNNIKIIFDIMHDSLKNKKKPYFFNIINYWIKLNKINYSLTNVCLKDNQIENIMKYKSNYPYGSHFEIIHINQYNQSNIYCLTNYIDSFKKIESFYHYRSVNENINRILSFTNYKNFNLHSFTNYKNFNLHSFTNYKGIKNLIKKYKIKAEINKSLLPKKLVGCFLHYFGLIKNFQLNLIEKIYYDELPLFNGNSIYTFDEILKVIMDESEIIKICSLIPTKIYKTKNYKFVKLLLNFNNKTYNSLFYINFDFNKILLYFSIENYNYIDKYILRKIKIDKSITDYSSYWIDFFK